MISCFVAVVDEKKAKACIKEGGKKGQDMAGMAALGGVKFFNLSIESAEGDLELLEKVMEGANTKVDESAEERKGGADDIGKLFFSAGDKQLVVLCHVPAELATEKSFSAKEWVETVMAPVGGKIVKEEGDFIAAVAEGDAEKGKFPLKMRDEAISAGFQFIKSKGLVPADDDSDDDVNYAEAAGVEW
jgi:hypothetical protein